MTDLLSLEDALLILDEMGLRVSDPGLLASALARPAAIVFGQDAYLDLSAKVAALLESVVRNHALRDGNRRAGWAVAAITIWLNDAELDYNEQDAFTMVSSVAAGRSGLPEITQWFSSRLR